MLLYQVYVAKTEISKNDMLKRKGNLTQNKISPVNLGKVWGEFAIKGQLDMRQYRGQITPDTHRLSHCSPGAKMDMYSQLPG